MGIRQRKEIAYWVMLTLGIVLNSFQVYKYVSNKLEYSKLELIVLVVGVAFQFFPKFILNIFEKIVTRKNDKDNG